ncbi:Exocyst complex component Exo70 [Sesbania bispinosa]|nr:Exocyst complex component Exo70 [Sesbania bispinosa]
MESKENLEAIRTYLTTSLETSIAIASALDESGSRLELLNQRCLSLQASLKPISMQKCSFVDICHGIDSVLCSATAVLKVFDSLHQLEDSLLTDPTSDLCTYISDTKKLEEALKLLTDNCRLAVGWLKSVFEFLQDKAITNEIYLLNIKKSLRILHVIEEGARHDGGLLSTAFDKLEIVFHRLLMANSMPLPLVSLTSHNGHQGSITTQSLPLPGEFESVQGMESYIDQWGSHLELVVKQLLEVEYRLSTNVFETIGPEAWMGCFAKIAIESGILSFIRFGRVVAERKNDPFKTVTKDLINKVVNGASEIFWQLPAQVKLQRPSSPPPDGSVPRLVSFVTDYCNQLLGDAYRPHLTQVLEIHLSWREEAYEEGVVFTQIYNIIKEVAVNLDAWSKAYEDITLSYLFMMNNHCHFYNLRVQKDILSSSEGKVTTQDLGRRLTAFNIAFEEKYKKQSNWVISDEILRENVCKHLVEAQIEEAW